MTIFRIEFQQEETKGEETNNNPISKVMVLLNKFNNNLSRISNK